MKKQAEKLVSAIDKGKHAYAKELLEKILKEKCKAKIASTLKDQEN